MGFFYFLGKRKFYLHLLIIIGVTILLLWLVLKSMDIFTQHGEVYIVPDFDGYTIEQLVEKGYDDYFQFEHIFNDFQSFEVSSPGLDRKLFNLKQYKNFIGDVVSLSLFSQVDGLRKIKGTLLNVLESEISVKTEKETVLLEFSNIEKGKLDLDDQIKKGK